jgi:uncharacterized protein YtpQ (UPF0354 family)
MIGWFKKMQSPAEPDRLDIVPRIKHTQFLASLREMDVPADQMPVTEPLVGDLLVTYAFDLPGAFQMVSSTDLERLSISPGEIRCIAIANLKRQIPEIGIAEESPLRRIVTGNDLEACTLLADTFWSDMTAEVPGEIVAAVPSRDVLLFCGSQATDGIRAMRELAEEVRRGESTHALSEHLLVWRGGKWLVYSA